MPSVILFPIPITIPIIDLLLATTFQSQKIFLKILKGNPKSGFLSPKKSSEIQGVGCCPYKDATCCKDRTHCCPHGNTYSHSHLSTCPHCPGLTCDIKAGRCLGASYSLLFARMLPAGGQKNLVLPLFNSFNHFLTFVSTEPNNLITKGEPWVSNQTKVS